MHILAQPSLGDEEIWQWDEEAQKRRVTALRAQARAAQLAVKNVFLDAEMSKQAMEQVWKTGTRLGGSDMLRWGGGEVIDPDTKSEPRLSEKVWTKYKGNYALAKDVSRFSVYYPEPAALLQGLRALKQAFNIAKIENRFRCPTVLGWRACPAAPRTLVYAVPSLPIHQPSTPCDDRT